MTCTGGVVMTWAGGVLFCTDGVVGVMICTGDDGDGVTIWTGDGVTSTGATWMGGAVTGAGGVVICTGGAVTWTDGAGPDSTTGVAD